MFVRKKKYRRDIEAWEAYAGACRSKLTQAEQDCPGPRRDLCDQLVEACRPLPVALGLTHGDPLGPVPPPRDELLWEIAELVAQIDAVTPNTSRALGDLRHPPQIEAA